MMKKLLKITETVTLQNLRYKSPIFKELIENLNKDCVKMSRPYFIYSPRNKPSKSVTVSPAGSSF